MLILRNPNLVAFESIAKHGTTHAAAKDLKITQTAVTQRLKALESELGMTFFLRSRRGMALTAEGKALLQFCRGSHELEGQFFSQVKGESRQEVALTIVGPTSAISTRIAENVKSLYARHPFLRLHLRSDDHADIVEMLRRGDADLGLVAPSAVPNEMDSKKLKPDKYVLVASAKWKNRKLSSILAEERVVDFYESDFTTKNYLKEFGLENEGMRERLFVNENDALICLLKEGVGFGTLTERIAQPHLDSGDLIVLNRGQTVEEPLALVWYPRPKKMQYFEDVLQAIK